MKISIKILLSAAFLFLPLSGFAQGSGSSEPTKSASGAARRDKSNFAMTRSVSGSITSLKNGSVIVKSASGKSVALRVTAKTRGGGCLQTGKNVRITYTPDDAAATLVRCK